jgi:excisionase family DNA binding protein
MTEPFGDEWVTTDVAAERTGYVRAYIRGLARRGTVRAHKVGRDWLVHLDDVLIHKRAMEALGEQRHNPWRADLVRQGRGRRHHE